MEKKESINKKPKYYSTLRLIICIGYIILLLLPENKYTNKIIIFIALIGNCLLIEVNGDWTPYGYMLIFCYYIFNLIHSYKMEDYNEKIEFIMFLVLFQYFLTNLLHEYNILNIIIFN